MAHVALGSASFGNAFETFPNKALGFAKGYLLTYYEKDAEMSRERLVGNQIGKSLSDAAERLPAFNRPVFFGLWRTLRAWLEIEAARSHPNAKPGDRGDQALITSLFNRIETAGALPPATAARMRRIKADATGFAQALSDLTPIMRAFAEYCHRDPSLRERTVQSLLAEYGRDPRFQTRVHRRLTKAGADTAVILAIDSVARLSLTDLNRLVGEKTAVGLFNEAPVHLEHIAQRLQAVAADGVRTTRSFEEQFDSNTNIIIDGEEVPLPTPGPYRLLLILIITAIMLIVEGVKIVIYLTEDRRVREKFAALSCPEIDALSDAEISDSIKILIGAVEGRKGEPNVTSNADEQSIIRVFGCLSDSRLRTLFAPLELDLLPEFQGPEYTQLVKRLVSAGAINPGTWDNRLVRNFANGADTATIQGLTTADARTMFLKLFDGWTGELDETAVVKLLAALPATTVRAVAAQSGTRRADFRDQLNGKERNEVLDLLDRDGVA